MASTVPDYRSEERRNAKIARHKQGGLSAMTSQDGANILSEHPLVSPAGSKLACVYAVQWFSFSESEAIDFPNFLGF